MNKPTRRNTLKWLGIAGVAAATGCASDQSNKSVAGGPGPSVIAVPSNDTSAAISGCTSIDSTANDNGFLSCARGHNGGASQHGSTADAVTRLLGCLGVSKGPGNLVGHGNDGIIVTGTGQSANDREKYISLWNQASWEPHLKRLRGHATALSLWACHPGTAASGADFLYNLAKILDAPVSGPTGFVYCNKNRQDLWLEAGSVWQVATPTKRPAPIAAPTPHFDHLIMQIALNTEKSNAIPLSDVVSIEYFAAHQGGDALVAKLEAQDAQALLQRVQFDEPFNPGGEPAAIVTATIKLTLKQGDKKEFLVYNNRLLQNAKDTDIYYRTFEGFGTALQNMR